LSIENLFAFSEKIKKTATRCIEKQKGGGFYTPAGGECFLLLFATPNAPNCNQKNKQINFC